MRMVFILLRLTNQMFSTGFAGLFLHAHKN
ncbi:Uncharacterised protein [Moraxella lacunata]|uniref:Uncharacterized protein n=1 Tax=Moraxella lacunata TaxID=477 RepID=A0A378T4J0_MORLA|nr:Uncharacterised protein [Moraxella lacunata]